MNKFVLATIFLSSAPLFSKEASYLGTDRADIEAGLRLYTEKQLADMKRKEKNQEQGVLPEVPEATAEVPQPPQTPPSQSWEEEVQSLLKAELPKSEGPKNHRYEPSPWEPSATPSLPTLDWQKTGLDGLGKAGELPLSEQVIIPAGSFVMADLLTGVDAPSQSSIPALIRTRRGFVSPNDGFVDLSGCHAIAQATGDLSTERVRFKTVTLSCLSPSHVPYQQAFTAYATGEDDSFGVPGELISRQGRVAMLAFLNGVVEGATKIVAQTSSTVVSPISALGNDSSSSAAVEVVRWYLEHAKSLVPTINVKAGVPIRLILLESLSLPKSYFGSFKKPLQETQKDEIMDIMD